MVISGGVVGISRVIGTLLDFGRRICDFSVEVHEGVRLTGLTCALSTTAGEADHLVEILRQVPDVVSVAEG